MASVNWMKVSTQKAGAMYTHMDNKARASHNHSNQEIDRTKTKLNYSIGSASWGDAMKRLKERTAEVDAVKPPLRVKKDRVTGCVLEFACPQAIMDMGRSDEFFARMHSLFQQEFGEKNVHGTFVHKDEIHEYTDSVTHEKRSSLEHAHTLVSVYTEEKGINGKAFESRERLKKLNKAVNEMCVQIFGIEYNTHETPRHQKVEDMKLESRLASMREECRDLQAQVQILTTQSEDLFGKNKLERQRLVKIQSMLTDIEKTLTTTPVEMYPEGVEERTRGVFTKEPVVTVPKKMWEDKFVSANAREGVTKALRAAQTLIQQLDGILQGKDKQLLKEQISGLQKARDSLAAELHNMRQQPTYADCMQQVNETLQSMQPAAAAQFIDAWNGLYDQNRDDISHDDGAR